MSMEGLAWLSIVGLMACIAVAPAFPAVRRRLGLTEDTHEARVVRSFLMSPVRTLRRERREPESGAVRPPEERPPHALTVLLAYPRQLPSESGRSVSKVETLLDVLEGDAARFAAAYDRWGEANALNSIGFIEERSGKFEKAADLHARALKLFREEEDRAESREGIREGVSDSLNNLGVVLGRLGRTENGGECHRAALGIRVNLDDARVANSYNNLGVLLSRHDPKEAMTNFERGADFAEASGDGRVLGKIVNNSTVLKLSLMRSRDLDQLRDQFDSCLPLRRGNEDLRGIAKTKNNLGIVHTALGDYELAEEHFDDAATLAGTVEDHVALLHVLENWLLLAEVHEHPVREPSKIKRRIEKHWISVVLPTAKTLFEDCERCEIEMGSEHPVESQVALLSSGSGTPATEEMLRERLDHELAS